MPNVVLPVGHVLLSFDPSDPLDAADLRRIIARRGSNGLSELIDHVVNHCEVGDNFVKPLVARMTPGIHYTAIQLAHLLGTGWTPRRVASKLCVLGRPEKEYNIRIFERVSDGVYSITPQMKTAIEAA